MWSSPPPLAPSPEQLAANKISAQETLELLRTPGDRPVFLKYRALDGMDVSGVDFRNVWVSDYEGNLYKAEDAFADLSLTHDCGLDNFRYNCDTIFASTEEKVSQIYANFKYEDDVIASIFGGPARRVTNECSQDLSTRILEGDELEKAINRLSPDRQEALLSSLAGASVKKNDVAVGLACQEILSAAKSNEITPDEALDHGAQIRRYLAVLKSSRETLKSSI